MKNKFVLFGTGLLMGISNFVPGASCGTLAICSHIHRETAIAAANIREHFVQSIKILLPLLVGMVVSIAFVLLSNQGQLSARIMLPVQYLFLGLTLGCLPGIIRKLRLARAAFSLWCLIPSAVMLLVLLLTYFWHPESGTVVYTRFDAKTFFLLFGSATFASAALFLPGLSPLYMVDAFQAGGYYQLMLENIHEITFLIPILCGCILGVVGIAWLIAFAYERAPYMMYLPLSILLVGSIPHLLGSCSGFGSAAVCLLFAAVGVVAAYQSSSQPSPIPPELLQMVEVKHDMQYKIQNWDDDFKELQ